MSGKGYHKNTTQKVLKNLYIIGISQHLSRIMDFRLT